MDRVKPRIARTWYAREGRFMWQCNAPPEGRWGMGISQQAIYDWRQAARWCAQANARAAA